MTIGNKHKRSNSLHKQYLTDRRWEEQEISTQIDNMKGRTKSMEKKYYKERLRRLENDMIETN